MEQHRVTLAIEGFVTPEFEKRNGTLKGLSLSGILPAEFGNLSHLQVIDVYGNFLNGTIPTTLSKIPLITFSIVGNRISGTIPEELGQISTLQEMVFDDNRLSGHLPKSLGNLRNLKKLLLCANSFTGTIPETFGNLKNLIEEDNRPEHIQFGFPESGEHDKLADLDTEKLLNYWKHPELPWWDAESEVSVSLKQLIKWRSTKLGAMLPKVFVISVILAPQRLTYTGALSVLVMCLITTLLARLRQLAARIHVINWCLKKDLSCPGDAKYYSLFINCGGGQMANEGHVGHYKASNTFKLSIDGPGYLQTARVSASSLRYYGLCLRKGSYTVKLHFAEIMFSNDTTFASLGNRVFDIYIQGTLKQKNFNIMKEAGGVGKGTTMNYTDISVNGSTLEIFLYWAGKGTTAIPERGVYGPLISAITVTPNFSVKAGLSVGAIVGIVIASCAVLPSILLLLRMKGCLGGKDDEDANEFRGLDTGFFLLRQIKAATNDFSPLNKIGEGGFGPVYKGVLPDGKVIAVKQLSAKSMQGNQELINEIGMITALQHPNLVKLHGCCIQGKELLLVYEYMENNSLGRGLFGREDVRLNLDWTTRKKISLGIAKGLAYLHEESSMKIVHRDIKANNVLRDKDMNAKISDFGLAKYDEDENTHISPRVAGTMGYMAPEYAMRGYLTPKADVYSFGVVLLEIVSGKTNTNYRPREEFCYLLDWAYVLQEQGNLLELVDSDLGTNYPRDEAMGFLNLSLLCANHSPTVRPNMSSVVRMIEGEIPVQAPKKENPSQDHPSTDISMSLPHSQVSRSLSTNEPIGNFSASVNSEDKPQQVHSSSFLTAPDDDDDEISSM
ncbi:putative LRR receptor-like serine/threonine-protein kinase [Drosera capensis]